MQTAQEAYHEGQARGLPIGPINSPDDLLCDEHLLAREFFVEVEHDDEPPAKYPGAPFRFSRYGPAPLTRAPLLGEHTDEVLGGARQPNEPRRKLMAEAFHHRDRCAIAGIGATDFSRDSGRSVLTLATEASLAALADAGLAPTDIDGIVRCDMDTGAPQRPRRRARA